MRMRDIAQAIARIDEHQTMRLGLDQQAMAYQMAKRSEAAPVEQGTADGTIGPTVQMMNMNDAILRRKRMGEPLVRPS